MADWVARLRQASFRGVPFGVLGDDDVGGRRLAVHEYPGRDDRFIEDLGASTPRIQMRGFLIEDSAVYGGGDVLAQRDRMRQAADLSGAGLLVHPTRGPVLVNVVTLSISEQWDEQRYFALQFELLEAGDAGLIAAAADTVAAVLGAASSAASLLSSLFGDDSDGYVGTSGVAGDTAGVAGLFGSSVLGLSGGVAGVFGLGTTAGSAALTAALATFSSASAGLGLVAGAGASTATAATGVVQALSASSDPGSAIDSLGDLAGDLGDDGE